MHQDRRQSIPRLEKLQQFADVRRRGHIHPNRWDVNVMELKSQMPGLVVRAKIRKDQSGIEQTDDPIRVDCFEGLVHLT